MDRSKIKTKKHSSSEKAVAVGLSLKITGIVFWGLVIIGLLLVAGAIKWQENDLVRHNDAMGNQTYTLIKEVLEQDPHASNKNVRAALTKVIEITGVAGINVKSERRGEFKIGAINEELVTRIFYISVFPPPALKGMPDNVTLKIYQIPIETIISTQKKNLLGLMGLLFFAFGMILQWILKRILSEPLENMVMTAKAFSEGKEITFDENRKDEFGYLASFINAALQSLSQRQSELSYQASHDKLTGLYNRNEFDRRLNQFLETSKKEDVSSTLCYMDLDQFKVINDTCGHIAGDELLKQIAQTLKSQLRESDFIARLGGDEFGVLLHGCYEDDAIMISNKLLKAVSSFHFLWEGKPFQIGVSIGVVPITAQSVSANDVLSAADVACYAAKDKGRNEVHLYEPDDLELQRRRGEMVWVSRIREALTNNSFRLYQQEIIPVEHNKHEKKRYEILLRMVDDEGIITPTTFLGAAELYGLMMEIDIWVISNTIDWMARNAEIVDDIGLIAINVSGQTVTSIKFLNKVKKIIKQSGIDTNKICFEITETSAIGNFDGAVKFIDTFRDMGCHFALDDFGSGMSSFSYLKNLHVDYLKIDGSYVKDMVNEPIDRAMVEAVNQIGHAMGIKTIAEFVESEATLGALSVIGVDYAQGYCICEPAPLDDLLH